MKNKTHLKKLQKAMIIFPGKYIANLEGDSKTPILSALYGAMLQVHLSGEEWFNIIRALLPEITTYTKLADVLNVQEFDFSASNLGTARVSQFTFFVDKMVAEETPFHPVL